MMTVYIKNPPEDRLDSASGYFDFVYFPEWFDDPFIREMVLDVDKTEVVSALQCISPVFGPMACTELSGGVKGLILVDKDPDCRNFRSSIWGGNCVKWLARLSFRVDFGLYLSHPMEFLSGAEKGTLPINAITEDGCKLNTCEEVWDYYAECS